MPAENTISILGDGEVYCKSESIQLKLRVDFGHSLGNLVYIGNGVSGNVSVKFTGSNSIVYIGDYCRLNGVQIRSFQNEDFVALGNYVSVTSNCVLISGNGAGNSNPAIIVGDDCMISNDVVIRSSDAHPMYSFDSGMQTNMPEAPVIIEPHVWLGERSLVLKSVTIGAGSVAASGSIVTKSCSRAAVVAGAPAKELQSGKGYWSRSETESSKIRALHYYRAFP
tara:strand:- start:661 stop:1332 length:672 start_codon:yes stop_codon:yes gene_type:complete